MTDEIDRDHTVPEDFVTNHPDIVMRLLESGPVVVTDNNGDCGPWNAPAFIENKEGLEKYLREVEENRALYRRLWGLGAGE